MLRFFIPGQPGEQMPVTITLSIDEDGDAVLTAQRGIVKSNLLRLETDGKVVRYKGVSPSLGFDLNDHGQLTVGA